MTAKVEARELLPSERELLCFLLERASFRGARELAAQVGRTHIVGGIPTLLDPEVRRPAPRSACKDGPIPLRAVDYSPDGEPEGEILVWVEDGYLSALEHAW